MGLRRCSRFGNLLSGSDSFLRRIQLWLGFFSKIEYPRDLPLVINAFRYRRLLPVPDMIWQKVDSVGGFLSRKEAGLLFWAACNCPVSGSVIELGSYEGRSTCVFALAGRFVHAVDAWDAWSLNVSDQSANGNGRISPDLVLLRFRENLRLMNVEHMVSVHRSTTHAIGRDWNKEGAILFVDAGHAYEDVEEDLRIWTKHLHPDGYLLMHDVLGDTYMGVTRAASELIHRGWHVLASSGSVVAFTRDQSGRL